MPVPVQIARDPFARHTLQRVAHEPEGKESCAWCGGFRRGGKLFRYAMEPDSRPQLRWIAGAFCSVGCMRSFHDL